MANKELIVESDLSTEQKVIGLLACIAQEQKVQMDRLIGATNLSLLQLQLLHALSETPNGCLTVNRLKSSVVDDNPNVSRTLNKLVDLRFVTKERCTEDQRTVFVSITNTGRQAHKKADQQLLAVSTGLAERDLQQLYTLLLKL